MFDWKLIRSFVRACPEDALAVDGIDVKSTERLQAYLDELADAVTRTPELLDCESLSEMHKAERDRIQKSPRIRHLSAVVHFCAGSFNYAVHEHVTPGSQPSDCLASILRHVLRVATGVLRSMLAEHPFALLVQLRQLYEAYVLLVFMCEHPELAETYSEHRWIAQYHLDKAFEVDMAGSEVEQHYKELIENHGAVFKTDYGWAAEYFGRSERPRLIDLVKDLKLEHMSSLYRMASQATHASSLFVHAEPDMDHLLGVASFAATEWLTTGTSDCLSAIGLPQRDRVVLMTLLLAMREERPESETP